MLSIKSKIKSLPENERLFFDKLASDEVNGVPRDFGDKLLELELVEKDNEGSLSMSFAVHVEWTELCAEELKGLH